MSTESTIDVRDMAIIHRTFRSSFAESADLVRANPTPSPERVEFLADHIDFGLEMLHTHHASEDEILYPLLAARCPDHASTLQAAEQQHQAIGSSISAVSQACADWRNAPTHAAGERLASSLGDLNAALQPHLDDEERDVVPLAATTLTQAEWDSVGEHSIAEIPRKKMPIAFGLITDPLDEADRAYMKSHLPAPVRILYPVLIARPWSKYSTTLRSGT